MKKWIITWDSGYGNNYSEVEAETEEEAGKIAYEEWQEESEANANYGVIGEATDELRENYL